MRSGLWGGRMHPATSPPCGAPAGGSWGLEGAWPALCGEGSSGRPSFIHSLIRSPLAAKKTWTPPPPPALQTLENVGRTPPCKTYFSSEALRGFERPFRGWHQAGEGLRRGCGGGGPQEVIQACFRAPGPQWRQGTARPDRLPEVPSCVV